MRNGKKKASDKFMICTLLGVLKFTKIPFDSQTPITYGIITQNIDKCNIPELVYSFVTSVVVYSKFPYWKIYRVYL